jgi:hypothetical protein
MRIPRIHATVLPWLWLIFAGLSTKFTLDHLLKLNVQFRKHIFSLKVKNLWAFTLSILFASATFLNFSAMPPLGRIPSCSTVQAAQYIYSEDQSMSSLVLGDQNLVAILSAVSHGKWLHIPYGYGLMGIEGELTSAWAKLVYYSSYNDSRNVLLTLYDVKNKVSERLYANYKLQLNIRDVYIVVDSEYINNTIIENMKRIFGLESKKIGSIYIFKYCICQSDEHY